MGATPFKPAKSISEVIERLDRIISSRGDGNKRLAFFAVLYRAVTVKIRDGISSGKYDDGERMERLDVIFANRYLQAFQQLKNQEQSSRCWSLSFVSAGKWRPLIMQHLLLGINAHINLDLGISAAQTCPGKLPALARDFQQINGILSEMLDVVQRRMARLSPLLGLLDKMGGRTDEAIINFSIQKAREQAWSFAMELDDRPDAEIAELIERKDQQTERLGKIVLSPGKLLSIIMLIIRIFETSNTGKIIKILQEEIHDAVEV